MGVEKPPSREDMAGWTNQLEQWAQNMPDDGVKGNTGELSKWLGQLKTFADQLNTQVQAMALLRIDEGAVGQFISATTTAQALNNTRDGIHDRLDDLVKFSNALHDFSQTAYNKLFEASKNMGPH